MAIKARETITIIKERDVNATWRFYRIASSTSTPSQPTEAQGKAYVNNQTVPSGWGISEPAYDGTSTNSLYTCDLTSFTDGEVSWSTVSKSSSYEAAKQAYNEAQNAKKTATNFVYQQTGGAAYFHAEDSGFDVNTADAVKITDKVEIMRNGKSVAEFGESARIGKDGVSHLYMDYHSMQMVDKDDNVYFRAGDARNENAYVTMRVVGDGETNDWVIPYAVDTRYWQIEVYNAEGEKDASYDVTSIYTHAVPGGRPNVSFISSKAPLPAGFIAYISFYVPGSSIPFLTFGSRFDNNNIGPESSTFGVGLIANDYCQSVFGRYNSWNSDGLQAFVIGNGNSDSSRSNAFAVGWDGIPYCRNKSNEYDSIFNLVYPVGSIYMSVSSTSPATLFGGTWQRIENRFLLAAGSSYSAGATGGEATHKLTVAEMPSHTHVQNQHRHSMAEIWSDGSGSETAYKMDSSRKRTTRYTAYSTPTNQNTGGGGAHNNMPPYLAVYVWKRTA